MDPYWRSIDWAHFAISEEKIDLSVIASAGRDQTCVPAELAQRVICACIRELCFFRDFMGLKRQKFSWSFLARHLYKDSLPGNLKQEV